MRHAPWLTTAIVMFGCAQGPVGDPPVDVAAGSTTAAPPEADAGAPPETPDAGFRACDPQIAAGEGVRISDTHACPGLMPAAPDCAAEVSICSGGTGDTGTTVAGATSDGRGSIVLSCHRNDVGPPVLNALFVPTRSGFVSKAPLGVDVRPLSDGFVTSTGGYNLPPPAYDFLAHDGTFRAEQRGGLLLSSAGRAVILRAVDTQLVAQSYAADGSLTAAPVVATLAGPAGSVMLGGSMNASGATLLLWQVYGESNAGARWLAADGSLGPAFSIAGWSSSIPVTAALAGGGIVVSAEPASGLGFERWRGVIAPGETAERPAPAWLASRAAFHLLPGGKAMAFGNEIVSADGTVCGNVDLAAPIVGVGLDGTAFTARSSKTFRVYPQLFRE